jgi:ABC-2 type transport system ATP-binding protein
MRAVAVEARGLTKSYGPRRGVVGLDFIVEAGEVFGYLGPNGAGKTTTIRVLLDFIRPTAGTAAIFALDSRADAAAIHRRIGYLPGELALYDNLSAGEFLRFVSALRGGVPWDRVEGLAARMQLDLKPRIRSLSHGNKQKVGLVQAFMHRPDLLVLDEPTQGLDPLVQQEFYGLIAEAKGEGRTVFLSSHVMPEVERVCDRVAIIREGRLVAVEDVGTLKARALRTVEFHFARPVPSAAFRGLPSVRDVIGMGDVIRCSVAGPLDAVVKTAARFEVVDVTTHEPSLEEAFLAYYGKDESHAA